MSENTIKVPSWAVPVVAAIIPAAIAWGSMQAQAQATDEEVAKVSKVVEKLEITMDLLLKLKLVKQQTKNLERLLSLCLKKGDEFKTSYSINHCHGRGRG